MRCKHENADHLKPGEHWHSQDGWGGSVALVEQFRCLDCGAWLSLGESNDEPEAVKVEIAAARRVTERRPDEIAAIDDAGCIYSVGVDNCRECQSWHLARAIATHEDPTE